MKTFKEFILECNELEEISIGEGIQPLPREKMLRKIYRKSRIAQNANETRKEWEKDGGIGSSLVQGRRKEVARIASQIKKMKYKLRNHDPIDSRFRELENRDRGGKE